MLKINELASKFNFKVNKIIKNGKVTILLTDKGNFVLKEKSDNKIYNYLNSRNFLYYPKIIGEYNNYEISEYEESFDIPLEYKIMDFIDLISLLHSKTTHYKEVNINDFKSIYEDINNNIMYLYEYFNDTMTIIESKVFMSPSQYLLACNISIIYKSLAYCKENIENWYNNVKDLTKQRVVVLHNNLELDHFIKNESPYFISWDKSTIGLPIFDLYKIYKKHYNSFDFISLFKKYETNYPLKEEEKQLLFILISMPYKLELTKSEYNNCLKTNDLISFINKSKILIENYNKAM